MTEGLPPVRIVRQFEATPENVWRAWTNPACVCSWWGSDPHGTVLEAALDVRTGGRFEITFCNADGSRHTSSGMYAQVEPGRCLAFSWVWRSEPEAESFVTVTFERAGRATRMFFEHARLAHASAHDYERGWQQAFDKLQRLLEEGSWP